MRNTYSHLKSFHMNPVIEHSFAVFLSLTAQSDQSDNLFCLSVSLNLVGYNATNMKNMA